MGQVIYVGASDDQVRWGGNDDPRPVFTEGEVYEVEDTEVHSWHTKIMLRGFPGLKFNSVCFNSVPPTTVATCKP